MYYLTIHDLCLSVSESALGTLRALLLQLCHGPWPFHLFWTPKFGAFISFTKGPRSFPTTLRSTPSRARHVKGAVRGSSISPSNFGLCAATGSKSISNSVCQWPPSRSATTSSDYRSDYLQSTTVHLLLPRNPDRHRRRRRRSSSCSSTGTGGRVGNRQLRQRRNDTPAERCRRRIHRVKRDQ